MPFAKGGKPEAKKGGRAKAAKKEKAPPVASEEPTVEVDTNIPLPASIEAISKAYMGLEMALALNHRLHTSPTLATLEATARRAQGASLTTEGLEALQCILPLTKGHLALFQLPKSKQKSGSQAEWTELFGVTPVDPARKAKLGEGDLDSWHAAPALKGRLEEFKLNLSREWQMGGKPSNPSALAECLRSQMPTGSKTVISKIRRALDALKKHQSQESGSGDILDIDSLLDEDAMPIVEEEAAGEDPNKPGEEGEDASGYFPPLTTMSVEDFVNERLLGPSGADRLCYCAKLPGREGRFVELNQLGSIITERIRALLVERGIPSLYKHQATAIEAALRKEHVLVSTSTSSGKSLCYVIPILSQLEAFDTNTFAAGPSSSLGSYEGPPPPDSLPMTPDAGPACALDLLALAEEGGVPSASLGALPAQIQASARMDSVGSSVIEVPCHRNATSITEIEESCPSVVLCDSQWQTQSQPTLQPPEAQAVSAPRVPIAPMEQAPPTASLLYSAGTDDDSCPRFIYLSPTKALGQDQLRSLKEFLPSHCHPWFATYDGDTTDIKDRYNVRRTARVLLTNPDMLHLNILPNHKQWAVWLRNLSYVVVDEAHSYRGVFGAHVAMVLRRLTRLCAMYKGIHIPSPDYPEGSEWGSDPTPTPLPLDACPFRFIVCSATLRNPAHHFLQLTGCRARLVHQDTSPSAARYIVTWNAPPIQSIQRAKAKALERLETSAKEEKKGKGKRGLKRGREGSPKSSPKLEREGEHNEVHPMEGVVEENPSPEEVDAERRRLLTDSEVHLDLWKYSDSMAREVSEGASPSKQEMQQQREREERFESRHMMLLEQKDMRDHLARRTKFGGLHPEERSSPYVEAGRVVAQLIMANIRTLVFVKVRQITELVLSYIKDSLMQHKCPHFASLVKCYRSGITPAERRQIERELFSGQLRGVVTTTALELGVDIGGLEAVVMVGYPGSCASLWQQMGRAGRGSAAGLAVMIGLGDPLNQFLLHNPRYLLCRPPEHTVVDPSNSHLLSSHLQCAAIEVPLSEEDETVGPALFGPSYPRIVKSIRNTSALVARPAREMLRKKGWARFPAHSLRIAAARIQYPNLEDENTQGGFFLPDTPLEGVEEVAGEDCGDDCIEGPDGKEKAEQKAEDKWLRRAVGEQEAVLVWEDTSEEAQARKRKKKRQAKSKPKAKPKAKGKRGRGRGRGKGRGSNANDDQAPEDPLALLAAEEEGCRMQDEEPLVSDSPKAGKGQEARGRQFHREVSLRSIAPEVFTVIREDTGDRLEDFHGFLAYMTVHEGAAYMCHGTTFLIVAFDHQSRTVTARPVNCSYHTRATDDTQVSHCHCEGAASIPLFPLDMLGGVKAEGPQQVDPRPPSLEVEVDMADMDPCVPSLDLITDTCGDSRMEEEDPQDFVDRKPGLPRWPTELTAKPCGCTASYQPTGPNASPSMGWMGPSMEGGEFIGDDQRLTRNPKARKRSRATNWEGWLGDPVPQLQSQPPVEDNNHLPTAAAVPPQTPTPPEAGAAQQAPRPPGVSILPPDFSAGSAPVPPEEPAPKRQKIIVVSPKVASAPKVENKVRKVKPEAQGPATHEPDMDMGAPASSPPPSHPRTPAKHSGEPSSDVSAGLAVLSEAYGGGSVVPSLDEPRLVSVHRGLIKYQQRVKGFHKIHKRTEELLETVSLHYPLAEHSTHGVWIDVPHEVKLMCQRDDPGCDFFAGIHSILHTLLSLFPLHVNCDIWDVMGVSTDCHPTRNNCACITIFDVVPGGAGISTRAFEDVPRLLHQCYRQLEACPCVNGCVSCIFSSRCGCYNMGLDKITARNILLHMLFHTEGRKEEEGPPAS